MIEILLFARLREQVGVSRMSYEPASLPVTVDALIAELRDLGDEWKTALGEDNLLCAVNQHQAGRAHPIDTGDEVAFFPPVTGG